MEGDVYIASGLARACVAAIAAISRSPDKTVFTNAREQREHLYFARVTSLSMAAARDAEDAAGQANLAGGCAGDYFSNALARGIVYDQMRMLIWHPRQNSAIGN